MAKVMYKVNGYKPDENGIRGNDYIEMSKWASKYISPFSEERRLLREKWNKTNKKIEWFEYLYKAAKRKKKRTSEKINTRKKAIKRASGKPIKVNGYTISHNPYFNEYSVTHPEIGYCTGFKLKRKAIEYAKKG